MSTLSFSHSLFFNRSNKFTKNPVHKIAGSVLKCRLKFDNKPKNVFVSLKIESDSILTKTVYCLTVKSMMLPIGVQ